MTVNISWYDEDEDILHYRFGETWTWEEYEPILKTGRCMMRRKPHYVAVLNDMRETINTPNMLIPKAKQTIDSRPPNTGMVIFVTSSLFFSSLFDVLTRLYPDISAQYLLETNMDIALARIRNWLKENSETRFDVELL